MIRCFRRHPQHRNYFISTVGEVLSFRGRKPRFLKTHQLNYGHLVVSLGQGQKQLVHRLVLETFVGPCPEGMECCHNNGNPSDNRLENLRWDTHSENNKDIVRHGHWKNPTRRGEEHGRHRFTWEDIKTIRELYEKGISQRQLAEDYDTGKTTIAHIVNGDTWKTDLQES